jgi:hypothetical protein
MNIGGIIGSFWPDDGDWPVALAGSTFRFALEYLPVRLLEWRRIFLRL